MRSLNSKTNSSLRRSHHVRYKSRFTSKRGKKIIKYKTAKATDIRKICTTEHHHRRHRYGSNEDSNESNFPESGEKTDVSGSVTKYEENSQSGPVYAHEIEEEGSLLSHNVKNLQTFN